MPMSFSGSVDSSWNSALPPPHLLWQWLQLACRYERARASSRLLLVVDNRPASAASPASAGSGLREQAEVLQRRELVGDARRRSRGRGSSAAC